MILLFIINIVFCQSWFNHPDLDWYSFETEHFILHYHKETERSAREAAYVAESIYFNVTSYYEFEPYSKTHIIVKDVNDYANGAAYFFDNKIEISALPLDFRLRGSHRWLQNVITHEFTHIVQIGASMKGPIRLPLGFIQIMGYEKEKRQDVLYGYPNKIISYPIPNVAVPPWLAEGTAQFMYPDATYDFWDTNRDMILRDRVINDNLLSLSQMNNFGNKGMGNESVYSQGFAFCKYLVNRFGYDILPQISKLTSNPFNYSIDKILKKATGINGKKLFVDWKLSIDEKYYNFKDDIEPDIVKGEIIQSEGTVNIFPVWAPNGSSFSFLSNRNNESFFRTDLYIFEIGDSTTTLIAPGVKSSATWKDDYTLFYSKLSEPNSVGSIYFDIYKYNIIKDKEDRLTYGSRLTSPLFIPKQNKLAAVKNYDGTSNIYISELDSVDFQKITNYDDGSYISSIKLDDTGSNIVFDLIDNHGKDIFVFSLEDFSVKPLHSNYYDEQDPTLYDLGLLFSNDQSGIFNLFFESEGQSGYLTNVVGGAFMPSVSKDGKIIYSLYEDASYNIAILDSINIIPNDKVGYNRYDFEYFDYDDKISGLNSNQSKKYTTQMSKLSLMPKLLFDYNTIKPGLYCSSFDLLDKLSLFGSMSVNSRKDLDLFLNFEYSNLFPTIYASLFWVTRHQSNSDYYYNNKGLILDNISLDYDLTFLLFAGEIGARYRYKNYKFWIDYSYSNYREHINQHIQQKNQDDVLNFHGDTAFDYYRGHGLSLTCEYAKSERRLLNNIIPRSGFYRKIKLGYEWNDFMDGFAINEEYSTFGANFKPNNTFRVLLDIKQHYTLSRKLNIASTFSGKFGWISDDNIDDFFYFFNGGETGVKGYTFYEEALTGPTQFVISNTLRFPIFTEKNFVFSNLNFQNFIVGFVLQAGGAPKINEINNFIKEGRYKVSSGVELRLNGFSFYSYPTAIEYSYHVPLLDGNYDIAKQYIKILFNF